MGTNTITYLDRTFDAHDVISGNAYYARPLNSASLEIDTFSFDVQSDDTSLTEFIRNTPLTFYHDGNQMGIFYVQTISRTSINTYHFTCTSTVGLLDETYHDGGIYTGETVRKVCTDICSPLTCYVKSNIANIKLYGWLPIATRRENLAQVLFAIGATLKVDYNGAIRIEGLWDGQSSEITASEMYAGGSVEYATPVTEVIVTEHAYSQSATEVTELFNGTTSAGDKITFDDPCYDLAATGFAITESGANYAIVTAGSGVLNGKKYTHVTRQIITPTNTRNRSLIEQSDNTVKVENATLVSLANATAIAERLAEYYSHNERINNKIAIKREIPGDVVQISHPYGGEVTGCIESVDVTVSGKLAAQESVLVGYKPQDIGEQEYYDTVEVLTENGAWTVPEGVTNLRVVLIGGGQGGQCGYKGESGSSVPASFSYGIAVAQATGYAVGLGGAGGAGGNAGHGGKVLQASISVRPNQSFTVVIGAGGKGAAYSDDMPMGTEGEDTLFGELSTITGAYSDNGYIDTLTSAVYADKGLSGISGGKGGSGTNKRPQDTKTIIEFVQGEDVIDEDGNTWRAGATPTTTYGDSKNSIYWRAKTATAKNNTGGLENGYGTAGSSAACGGGAAAGTNGTDSAQGTGSYSASASGSVVYVRATGHSGIDGAVPSLIPKTPTMYGRGGRGGYGGGGAGGSGMSFVAKRTGSAVSNVSGSASAGAAGSGGNGGTGGDGAPGCVLIYYRLPKALSASGAVHDKNGKIISDKYGRRLVV